jgi:hypothetical protein
MTRDEIAGKCQAGSSGKICYSTPPVRADARRNRNLLWQNENIA